MTSQTRERSHSDLSTTEYVSHVQVVTLPGGTTYRYVHIAPPDRDTGKKPYILFLHGFPSTSYDWRHQISYFSKKGYGILAPDLLGYGGTDKPKELEAFRYKKMADEVVGILDHEQVEKVLGVAHDWGCILLSRLANHHPSRFLSYAFLDVAYLPPTQQLDMESIKAINQMSHATMGYQVFGYWLFFNEPDAAEILDSHPESAWSMTYPEDYKTWTTGVLPEGALRKWLTENKILPKPSYVSEEERSTLINIFSKNGGYGPALNWYRAALRGVNEADDKAIPKEHVTMNQPVLLILGTQSPITPAEVAEKNTAAYALDLHTNHVNAGHWVQLEVKDEANKLLEEFFEKKVLSTSSPKASL